MLFLASFAVAIGILIAASAWFSRGPASAYTTEAGEASYRRLTRGWYASWNRAARGAGLHPSTPTRAGNTAIAVSCVGVLGGIVAYGPLLGPVLTAAVVGGSFAGMSALGQRKRSQIEPLLKDFTAAMADRATRSPLRDAFMHAADESDEPLHSILSPYAAAIKSGASFGGTLRQAAIDLDNETFSMVAATVDAASESSARSTSGALYRLSGSIRDREQARKEIWSAGKTTRLARHIYTILPPVILGFGVLSNPTPWQTPLGVGAIVAVIAIVIGGRQLMVWLERWQMDY